MATSPVEIKWSRYIPHEPHPKQHAFLWLDCREAFYGGAAGGGKSDALLMAALQYVDIPGYAAILFRKTYTDLELPGAIMDRAEQWLAPTDAKWNQNDKEFTFPSGAKLTFGYLQRPKDKFRYQSAEFQFIGFDELTQFEEDEYTWMSNRLRRVKHGALAKVPLRLRGASNPGGTGHRWVKGRFIDGRGTDRVFIPSALPDNPSLDQEEYEESLALLDPITYAQYRHGDWSVRPPGYWLFDSRHIAAAVELGREWDLAVAKGSPDAPVPRGDRVTSGVDYGDFQTVMLPAWEVERGGLYLPPKEVVKSRADLEDIADDFLAQMNQYPYWWHELRYDASFKQSARTVGAMLQKKMGRHNPVKETGRPSLHPVSFKDYKDLSIKYLRLLLKGAYDDTRDRALAISPQNELFIAQMEDATGKEDDPEKMEKGNDDSVDAGIAVAKPLAKKHRALIEQLEQAAKAKGEPAPTQPPGVEEEHELLESQVA